MSTQHTPGPWAQGITLHTEQTRRWTASQIEENNKIERRMVFAGFTHIDQGRGRQLIAICEREEDARLVAAAPALLEAMMLCYEHCRVYHPEIETNNVGKAVRAAIAKAKGKEGGAG